MDLRCMIIDDNVCFRRAIRSMIEHDGAVVVGTAANGAEAVERAERHRPDVLLIDVRLGDESGFAVARQIEARAAAAGWRPLIILLSTLARDELAGLIAAHPSFSFLDKTTVTFEKIKELHLAQTGKREANWR